MFAEITAAGKLKLVNHLGVDLGVSTIRVATYCYEADVGEQHIDMATKMGFVSVGFLLMAHIARPEMLLEQAKLMEGYGANCIYCPDSAGHMLPDEIMASTSTKSWMLQKTGLSQYSTNLSEWTEMP
ncbi:MAG: hypothetical protein ABW092_00875 [Candidatus Thiodiazotropha sp.]